MNFAQGRHPPLAESHSICNTMLHTKLVDQVREGLDQLVARGSHPDLLQVGEDRQELAGDVALTDHPLVKAG